METPTTQPTKPSVGASLSSWRFKDAFSFSQQPSTMTVTENFRELRLDNTVLSKMINKEAASKFYVFARQSTVASLRGVFAATGALFGFLSLLEVTPTWTSFIYLVGLMPELLTMFLHIDVSAHALLIREFEYIIVVLSGGLFAGILAYVLQDLRSVVPLTMFLVVLSSQAQDASIPFEQHRLSAATYYLVGGAACIAVYVLIQFGFVPNLNQSQLMFQGNNRLITISDVQFGCDRLITAAFFLLKQAFVAYFYPDSFVTLRTMIRKKIVLDSSTGTVSDEQAVANIA